MKISQPLVSVIVPIYDVEPYLKYCVKSIVSQTYQNLEIILVDDGSTDNSGAMCDTYATQDKRISVIHKKNGGLSDARNAGITRSTGEYITFIDSDDYVATNHIEVLLNSATRHNAKLSIINPQVTRKYSAPKQAAVAQKDLSFTTPEALRATLLNKPFTVTANGKLYARELFNTICYPKNKLYEDNETTYKLLMQCDKIVYNPSKTYFYVMRPNSITNSDFNPKKLDYITLTNQACSEIVSEYPTLSNYCQNRMAVARLSILRQALASPSNPTATETARELTDYFKANFGKLMFNTTISIKIKISILLMSLSPHLLNMAGRIYEKVK